MQRVESESIVTAMVADHGAAVSTFALARRFLSSSVSPVLSVFVSIISLSSLALLSLLVLTSPAVSLVSGGAGLTKIDTGKTLGG